MENKKYEYELVRAGLPKLKKQCRERKLVHLWRQYVIAGIVNVGCLAGGFGVAWIVPGFTKLHNITTSPLSYVITSGQETCIISVSAVGSVSGLFLGGFMASRSGRKYGLICFIIPASSGWVLTLIGSNIIMIYISRLLLGIALGIMFSISPMYCAEIATVDTRGALGSLIRIFNMLGVLLMYCIGPFVSYSAIAYIGIIIVTLYGIGVFFIPESPIFHLMKNNKDAATDCLARIRGQSHKAVEIEIDKMDVEVKTAMKKTATISSLFRGTNFKALFLSCTLYCLQGFCGTDVILSYLSKILEASGTSLDSSIGCIIVGAMLVLSSCITPLLVDRIGRRILLFISTIGTGLSLLVLGTYFVLEEKKIPVVANLGFVPVLALMLNVILYGMGLGSLPSVLMSELLPVEVKTTAAPIATSLYYSFCFAAVWVFTPVAETIGMSAAFFMFGVNCIFGFFFTLFYVPETKGKSFQEIQNILSGKSTRSTDKV